MANARSLVLTRFRPEAPRGGAALRNWQNINALARLGEVDVLSIGDETSGGELRNIGEWIACPPAKEPLKERVRRRLWPLRPGAHPGIEMYVRANAVRWLRKELLRRRYDRVVIEELWLAGYIDVLKRCGVKIVFDAHNVECELRAEISQSSQRPNGRRDRIKRVLLKERLMSYEGYAVRAADIVWTCSDVDKEQLLRLYGPVRSVHTVPNAVNLAQYNLEAAKYQTDDWSDRTIRMVFIGTFSYAPNEVAALRLVNEVLPVVAATGKRAKVVLVGRDPTARLRSLAADSLDVEVTGAVDSILPYLEEPCAVVLPIDLGSGTRLKVLESFAIRKPVICTRKAAEGIDVIDGEHVLLRESSEDIAAAVLNVFGNPELRSRLCTQAYRLLERDYSWDMAAERLHQSLR